MNHLSTLLESSIDYQKLKDKKDSLLKRLTEVNEEMRKMRDEAIKIQNEQHSEGIESEMIFI